MSDKVKFGIIISLALCLFIPLIIDLTTSSKIPVEGVIRNKVYVPDREWYTLEAQYDSNNKFIGYTNVYHYDPPEYILDVEFDGGFESISTSRNVFYSKKISDVVSGYKLQGGLSGIIFQTVIL